MEEIKVVKIKEYDKFNSAYEREKDIENKVVDYIMQSKENKNKLVGIKIV